MGGTGEPRTDEHGSRAHTARTDAAARPRTGPRRRDSPAPPGPAGRAPRAAHAWRPARFLVIAAHPDDAEFGPAATAAAWIDAGSVGRLVCCTSGDQGGEDPGADPLALAAAREEEQRRAAAIVGYDEVVFLHQPDGALANELPLRELLVREIRRFRPDAVLTHDPEVLFYRGAGVNHADHRAAGMAAVDAVFPAARNPMAFPGLARAGLAAHAVRRLYLFWPNAPTAWVDVERDRRAQDRRPPLPRQPGRRSRGAGIAASGPGWPRRASRSARRPARPSAWSSSTTSRTRARTGRRRPDPAARAGRGSGGGEEERPDASPGVPEVAEVLRPAAEQVDHLAERQVARRLGDEPPGVDAHLLEQAGQLGLRRPDPDRASGRGRRSRPRARAPAGRGTARRRSRRARRSGTRAPRAPP